MHVTSEQIRAARALLRWEQKELAERSGVSLPSVKRLEQAPGPLAAHGKTIAALQGALERAGVDFTNGGSPGVRLRPIGVGEQVRLIPGTLAWGEQPEDVKNGVGVVFDCPNDPTMHRISVGYPAQGVDRLELIGWAAGLFVRA